MPEYYYQIKGRNQDGNWAWPPLYSDKIEADDSKQARTLLEDMYGVILPQRPQKGDNSSPFLLTLTPLDSASYIRDRFIKKYCRQCGVEFTEIEKYKLNAGGQRDFCSVGCTDQYKIENSIGDVNFDFNGLHDPVIYKITNSVTNLCYIGKTTQAFTLRWYQHFFQRTNSTKFYEAIRKYDLTNWTFQVIELIEIPAGVIGEEKHRLILDRETYWMNHYDSIRNGYNAVVSVNKKVDDPNVLKLFE